MVKPHTRPSAKGHRGRRANTATKASTAESRSPKAAGAARASGRGGAPVTPGTRKVSPAVRKVLTSSKGSKAVARGTVRRRGTSFYKQKTAYEMKLATISTRNQIPLYIYPPDM